MELMNRLARLALVAAAAAFPAVGARAQESKPMVAVMLFNADVAPQLAGEYAGLDKAIADFLTSEMSGNSNARVIGRGQVQRAIDAQRLPAGARMTRDAALAAARSLGARTIVVGRFMPDADGNLRIDARAVDVASGVVQYTDRVQDKGDSIVPLIGRLAARLYGGIGIAAAARASDVGTALSMRAAITYGRALDAADRGERARAAELYGAVLRDYPAYEPAKRGLATLKPDV